MRTFFLIITFVIASSGFGLAQATEKSSCPTITVTGPAGIISPGDLMRFKADIKPFDPERFALVWKVESPDVKDLVIETGQGTMEIGVRTYNLPYNITATLKVLGFPEGCANVASETAGVASCGLIAVTDEYGKISRVDEKARIDNLALQLLNQPDFVGLLVLKVPKSHSRNAIDKHIAQIRQRLRQKHGIPVDRVIFVFKNADEIITTIYLMSLKDANGRSEVEHDLDKFRPKLSTKSK